MARGSPSGYSGWPKPGRALATAGAMPPRPLRHRRPGRWRRAAPRPGRSAPPCSGPPLSAARPPMTQAAGAAPVEAITRTAKVEALSSWSAVSTRANRSTSAAGQSRPQTSADAGAPGALLGSRHRCRPGGDVAQQRRRARDRPRAAAAGRGSRRIGVAWCRGGGQRRPARRRGGDRRRERILLAAIPTAIARHPPGWLGRPAPPHRGRDRTGVRRSIRVMRDSEPAGRNPRSPPPLGPAHRPTMLGLDQALDILGAIQPPPGIAGVDLGADHAAADIGVERPRG